MLKILIVDDEAPARKRIISFLRKLSPDAQAFEAENGIEALELISKHEFATVFLDIQMPEMDGFQLLANLETRNFPVVFQTAYDEYAIKAFEVSACDYLLKPFSEERFQKSLQKALKTNNPRKSLDHLEILRREEGRYLQSLAAKSGNKTLLHKIEEVYCFTSENHCTVAYLEKREEILSLSLTNLEEKLDPAKFQRVHRNAIVQLAKIKSYSAGPNMKLELANSREIPVSRQCRARVLDYFSKRKF